MSDRSGTGAAANANGSKMHFKSPLATANSASGSVSRVDHKQDHRAPPQPTLGARDALGIEAPCLESTQLDANMGGTTSISASGELHSCTCSQLVHHTVDHSNANLICLNLSTAKSQYKVSAASSTSLPGHDQQGLDTTKPHNTQPCTAQDIGSDKIDPHCPPLQVQDALDSDQVELSSKDKMPGACNGNQKSNEPGNPKEDGIYMEDPLQIPSSFVRCNFASRSFSELKEFVVNQRRKQHGNDDDRKGVNDPQRPAKEGHIFSLQYNVHTFSALANWALLPVPMTTSANKKQNHAKCRKIEMRNKLDAQYHDRILLPPAPFRKCTICGKFGHIEAECDMLFDVAESSHSTALQTSGQPCAAVGAHSTQKRAALDAGTATPSLDSRPAEEQLLDSAIMVSKKEEMKDVVLKLSHELSIQSKQLQLISADSKNKKRKRNSKGATDRLLLDSFVEDEFQSQVCKTCGCGFGDVEMIVCDGCESLLHLSCLEPPLKRVPAGKWFCDDCLKCDSETSSTVELEGCEDFFIEQRKMSMAKELWRKANLKTNLTLGYSKGVDCESAIAVVNEIEVEKSTYMTRHMNRNKKSTGTGGFFVSEICWARDNQTWYPGMVRGECGQSRSQIMH